MQDKKEMHEVGSGVDLKTLIPLRGGGWGGFGRGVCVSVTYGCNHFLSTIGASANVEYSGGPS